MAWTDSPPTEGPLLAERYRLVSRIGEGGMAGVYRGWDNRLRVWRAVKVLLPEFARKEKIRRRFEREAHTMARLEHRNLVRVVDVGTSGALPFIVMELVPCGTLMQWVEQNGPMPERMCLDAMLQVADGLAEVHRSGVIHRDIKPHNVLINEQGICKITDFGIAQEVEEGLTRAGSVMGTLGYMAPEQRNDASSVDQRADVFGFGATLWKLTTGRPLRDLFMYTEDPSIMEGIDEGLAEVLMACLAYMRDDRPNDIEEVADALKAVRDALPEPSPSTPPLPIAGKLESEEAASLTFVEIAPAFGDSEFSGSSETDVPDNSFGPSLVEASPRSSTLPYGLPQRMEAPPEDEPSWVITEDSSTRLHEPFDIRPEAGHVGAAHMVGNERSHSFSQESEPGRWSEEAEPEVRPTYLSEPDVPRQESFEPSATATVPEAAEEEDAGPSISPEMIGMVIRFGAVAIIVLFIAVAGFFAWARTGVTELSVVSDKASASLYVALDEERNVATELVQFDRGASTLQGLYLDYLDHPREPERWARAMVFIDELEHYGKAATVDSNGLNVSQKVQRIRGARDEAVGARRAYYDSAWSFPGVFAVTVGLAPTPSFDAESLGGS